MNPLFAELIRGATTVAIQQWLRWVEKQQRPEGWKPSEADIANFLADLDRDTPEAIRAEARAELEAEGKPIVNP